MNLIKIKVIINNPNSPYHYEGDAYEHLDLIKYNNLNEEFIYDKKIERVTKTNLNGSIIVDFLNKVIIIKSKEKTLNININLIKRKITKNQFYYLYKIDDNKIEFIIKKEV